MSKAEDKRNWFLQAKANPCVDCGGTFPPECMDFDHRNPDAKLFHISAGYGMSLEALQAEAAKCDLVCANCHRIRTRARSVGRPRPRGARDQAREDARETRVLSTAGARTRGTYRGPYARRG